MFATANLRDGLLFAPVIEPEHEGAILTRRSHQLLEEGHFHDVPIVMGYNSMEALLDEIPGTLLETFTANSGYFIHHQEKKRLPMNYQFKLFKFFD